MKTASNEVTLAANALPVLSAGWKARESADPKTLAAIAQAHAFEVWGEKTAAGEPFPVADASGEVCAMVYPFALGATVFPGDASQFGSIYVAVRPTSRPVLLVAYALHPVFRHGLEAQRIGRSHLRTPEASLTRIYWLGLEQEYYEIAAGDQRVLLDVRTLAPVDTEKALHMVEGKAEESSAMTRDLMPFTKPDPLEKVEESSATALDLTQFTIPGLSAAEVGGKPVALEMQAVAPILKLVPLDCCVPSVDWTWWCVPTAWTMATCYYDNYTKNCGGIIGYGRLMTFWQDDPKSGNNVPDFINTIIDPNTGTWRTGFNGYSDFIKKTYGYSFTTRDVKASAANDWAWGDITAEINAGRPFVWGVPNHATCAFGYRVVSTGSKYVVIHTTWGKDDATQRQEWLYTQGTGLAAITPGGGTPGQDLVIWDPDGGQSLLTNVPTVVRWYVWGNQIKKADIAVSTDGGNTWAGIVQSVACQPGWNQCDWTPDRVTARARVRVRGSDVAGSLVAGDGSRNNLKVALGSPLQQPALAALGGKLYLAWKGLPGDEGIYWTSGDGTTWATQQRVASVGTSSGAAFAALGNTLYMAWKGIKGDQGIYWSSFNGTTWTSPQQVPGVSSSVGPKLAVFNGKVYMIWKGVEGDPGIYWSALTGAAWAPQQRINGVGTVYGPAVVLFNNELYAAWRGVSGDQGIYWSSFNGKTWAPQKQIAGVSSTFGPTLAVFGNLLYAAWKGRLSDERLFWSAFDGTAWASQQQIAGVSSSVGPGLAAFNNALYAVWKGQSNDTRLWFSHFDGKTWAPQQFIPGVGSGPDV